MKKWMRYTALGLMLLCMTLQSAAAVDTVEVPIIMYHSLAGQGRSTSVSGEAFEADLRYLRDQGYEAVTLGALADFVHQGIALPERPIVLSFDDGYYNNYAVGLPLACGYDTPIVVAVIGKDTEIWSDIPSADMKNGHVTWEQIREMAESGVVEIANHTWDLHKNEHGRRGAAIRPGEDAGQYREVLRADLGKLQGELTERVGVTPIAFVYPFGALCSEATEILREMGFLVSLSCYDGMNTLRIGDMSCLYDLRRYERRPDRSVEEILTAIAVC